MTDNEVSIFNPSLPTLPEQPIFRDGNNEEYIHAVANAPLKAVALWLTAICTECGHEPIAEGTESQHGMLDEFVLIGCEGYWLINPNAVGIYNPHWSDWADR